MATAPKPWWKPAHKSGQDDWETAIGTDRNCPYCRHSQESHETTKEPSTGEITIRCYNCGPYRVHTRLCIVLPSTGHRATLNAAV